MIEALMTEILIKNQGYSCLVLECKSVALRNFLLEHLNTLCDKDGITIQHYIHLNSTTIIIPDTALQYFSQICIKQNYLLGSTEKILDISYLSNQFFPPETYINPVQECIWLKQKVEQLEQENKQLKSRMAKLEKLINNLLTSSASPQNRYHFHQGSHNSTRNKKTAQEQDQGQVKASSNTSFDPLMFLNFTK